MTSDKLKKALYNYIQDPKNPIYNFALGKCYEDEGHTAAAASFYIRTAEFGHDDLLIYEALLRTALCFYHQGSRVFTTKGILLRALSLMPERPEAYFLLSRAYEVNKDWQEAYSFAIMGQNLKDKNPSKLITDVEYPGEYGFTFERAVSAWWIGLWDESIFLFRQLEKNIDLGPIYLNSVKTNLKNLGNTWKEPMLYNNSYYEYLRVKFPKASEIEQNYSQCYQDMFVLTMLNGKQNGAFLEIGCADPFYGNNTALLEKKFEWNGISIDFDKSQINKWEGNRKAITICGDATQINYEELLKNYKDIDYLQLDCDPPIITYNTLLKIPFEKHKFAVITFEHDHYIDPDADTQRKSRKYLQSFGYELVVNNIAPDKFCSFEDWWVHPDLIDRNIIDKMKCISDSPKKADDYMQGRI